jgi:hypothetical protein
MPLTVPNIGEQESLRYLVNYGLAKPTNLILKLLSTATSVSWAGPTESDTPTSLLAATGTIKEPYTYSSGGTSASTPLGYPACDAPYANQYGKLLDGSNWTCTQAEGTDTTTASYPEQTFTFTSGNTYIHGYMVCRANSIKQDFLNNTTASVTVAAASALTGTASTATANGGPNGFATNTLGSPYCQVNAVASPTGSAGAFNSSSFTVSSATGIVVGQYAVGTGIGPYARVTAINSTTISLSVPCTGTVSGTVNFYEGRWAQGQDISGTGIPASTKINGYDPMTGIITLSQNANATISGTITAAFKVISGTAHGGLPGDVVYLARQSGNSTLVAGTYLINHCPDANSFETIPAIDNTASATGGSNGVVIYDSIMFLEKFTNGPYYIQNNGDQIKITLNVSLS